MEPHCASHHEYMQIVTCLLNASAYSFLHSVGCIIASACKLVRAMVNCILLNAYMYISFHLHNCLEFRYRCYCFV